MNKVPVRVAKDFVGFIYSQVSMPIQIWIKFWEEFRKN